jgi:hypothetical protein
MVGFGELGGRGADSDADRPRPSAAGLLSRSRNLITRNSLASETAAPDKTCPLPQGCTTIEVLTTDASSPQLPSRVRERLKRVLNSKEPSPIHPHTSPSLTTFRPPSISPVVNPCNSHHLTTPTESAMTGGHFERKDAVGEGVKGTLIVGGVGAIMSGIQNSLSKQNIGAMGVITKTGATIGIFGMQASQSL